MRLSIGGALAARQRFELPFGFARKLVGVNVLELASSISASWNQLGGWLRAMDGLRRAA